MSVLTQIRRRGRILPPPPTDFDDGSGGSGSSFPVSRAYIATWVLLTAVIMLFAGLSSAYIVLRGTPEWQNITVPRIVWGNTLVLFASSLAIEFARHAVRRNHPEGVRQWVVVSGILGFAFLVGQLVAWQQLIKAGVYLATTIHSSFFYVLTGAHALHLLGGLIGLAYVLQKAFANQLTATNHEPLKAFALYWHFMDVVWIYCFILLLFA
ncbi:MAG TPA: heme-copper oxidase subunit III [Terriglobia bacterium]|nr:heme-copper oxidase subunit III [Terriglobia bacterium]